MSPAGLQHHGLSGALNGVTEYVVSIDGETKMSDNKPWIESPIDASVVHGRY